MEFNILVKNSLWYILYENFKLLWKDANLTFYIVSLLVLLPPDICSANKCFKNMAQSVSVCNLNFVDLFGQYAQLGQILSFCVACLSRKDT